MAAYHWYELASAALEIGIVLASAGIITGVIALLWISGGLGAIGIVLALFLSTIEAFRFLGEEADS